MSSLKLSHRTHQAHGDADGRRIGGPALLESLVELVAGITRAHGDLESACWADDEYEYMEVTLPAEIDLELDLNVHGSRVLIRSIRDDDQDESGSISISTGTE
jgi:hypothetical protein